MPQPSQYQARRLLELVSLNRARVRDSDHVEVDHWARTQPPLQGIVYDDRETARQTLYSGQLGAVPAHPPALNLQHVAAQQQPRVDVHTAHIVSHQQRNVQPMPRVESTGSKMSKVSSVPSFGKIREPLSGSSIRLEQEHEPHEQSHQQLHRHNSAARVTPAHYEEFGSEALITNVYDDVDEDFDDGTPSSLFRQIGPSISMAHGIGSAPQRDQHEQPPPELAENHQDHFQPVDQPYQPPSPPSDAPHHRVTESPPSSHQPSASFSDQQHAFAHGAQHGTERVPPVSPSQQIGKLRGETGKIATPPPRRVPHAQLPPTVPRASAPPPTPPPPTPPPPPPPPPPPFVAVRSYGEDDSIPPPPSTPPNARFVGRQQSANKSLHSYDQRQHVSEAYEYSKTARTTNGENGATATYEKDVNGMIAAEQHRYTGEVGEAIVAHEAYNSASALTELA